MPTKRLSRSLPEDWIRPMIDLHATPLGPIFKTPWNLHLDHPLEHEISSTQPVMNFGQSGLVVWFTGLSGAGKTTLALSVAKQLLKYGHRTYVVDGDVLRMGPCSDLGYSEADRHEQCKRAGTLSVLMAESGSICLTALISPFRADRDWVRGQLPTGRFLEVFVNTPLDVCELRDVKGLYRQARDGKLDGFTGVTSVYEPPESPEVEIRNSCLEANTQLLIQAIEQRSLYHIPGREFMPLSKPASQLRV